MLQRLTTYALLGLIAVLAYLFGSFTFGGGLERHIASADFMNFMLGGKLVAGGQGAAGQLYEIAMQARMQQAMTAPYGLRFDAGLLPFVSIPLVGLIAAPFAALPLVWGYALWNLLQLALFTLAMWLLQPLVLPRYLGLLWLGGWAYLPLYASFTLGQVSPTLLLGVVLLWRGLRAGDWAEWWGGVGLGLLLLKPQLLPLFLLYLLYRRRWRAIGGFAAAAAVVYLLSALVSGWDWPAPYLAILQWAGSQRGNFGFYPQVMYNLRGLLARFGLDYLPLLTIFTFIVVATLVYAWWSSDSVTEDEQGRKLDLQMAATTLAAALTSLHLYVHDLSIIIFSGAVLLGWAARYRWPTWLAAGLLLGVAIPTLLYGQIPFDALYILLLLAAFVMVVRLMLLRAPVADRLADEGGVA